MIYKYNKMMLKPDRDKAICELCNNKKVLHIGATDSPYTQQKLDQNLLLHRHLESSAQELYGIDIDQPSIDLLKQHGISNITFFDMNKLGDLNFSPDIIVFGEIIEHLQNLEAALTNIKSIMTSNTELVISTPNLLYTLSFLTALLKNFEMIHEDHVVGFTYGAIRQLLEKNGFILSDFYFTFLPRSRENGKKKIIRNICKLRPGVAETLLVVAKLNPNAPASATPAD